MVNDVKHIFMYLLAIYMCSLEKYLFSYFAHLLIKLFGCLLLRCRNALCTLDMVFKYVLPCHRLTFHFVDFFSFCSEAL